MERKRVAGGVAPDPGHHAAKAPGRVGAVVGVEGNGVTTWVKAIHGRSSCVEGGSPWVFEVVHEEDAALPVDPTVGTIDQVIGGVVGV